METWRSQILVSQNKDLMIKPKTKKPTLSVELQNIWLQRSLLVQAMIKQLIGGVW